MYRKPSLLLRRIADPALMWVIRRGFSPRGSQVLRVHGRSSGEMRETPVNPLELDGELYLVAPRGTTHWVRNLRAAGEGELLRGEERTRFRAENLENSEKAPVLKAYLQRWEQETSRQFGIKPDAALEQFAAIAPLHPVFRLVDVQKQPAEGQG
ncbi:MAG: nitroreductase family deazaflavin-dependent oxidoreductase [Dehalococcoidia bacterium]|nr:nitroreductase family deazaflavin-dependent oxidoreductase [Dehalococcoidia bacterium]